MLLPNIGFDDSVSQKEKSMSLFLRLMIEGVCHAENAEPALHGKNRNGPIISEPSGANGPQAISPLIPGNAI